MAIDMEQLVEVRWSYKNRKKYEEGGHVFTKYKDTLIVKAKDLPESSNQRINYTCDICGDVVNIKYQAYVKKHTKEDKTDTCFKCSGYKIGDKLKYTYSDVVKIFSNNKCILTSKTYKSNNDYLKYIARCGHENTITLKDFLRGRGLNCSKCRNKHANDYRKTDIETIRNMFRDDNCELLDNDYKNSSTPMKYRCECGNICKISLSHFKRGERCNCSRKWKSGKEHHLYNTERTDEERIIGRRYIGYQQWRIAVFARDNYTCQCCGVKGVQMNAHHMYNHAEHPELRTEVSNGITLCENSCHGAYHMIYGKSKNTKEQLDEFIEMNQCYHVSNRTA